jgi:hypothetical protein
VYGRRRAPEIIWVSRNRSRNVETRLIVAYSLIAIMAGIVLWGALMLSKKQDKDRRRDSGKGDY